MNNDNCTQKDCDRLKINNSNFCWEHSKNADVISNLKNLSGEISNVFIYGFENLNEITFKDLVTNSFDISNSTLDNIVFINCTFKYSNFTNSNFDNVIFDNCSFVTSEWTKINIQFESKLIDCAFDDCRFTSCLFHEDPNLTSLKFNDTEFISCTFYGLTKFENLNFYDCGFLSSSFTEIIAKKIVFERCEFSETRFRDLELIDSSFIDVAHDFEIELPLLCDFSRLKIINTDFPKEFKLWNNLDEDKSNFYFRIVSLIDNQDHPNYLQELNVCVEHLYKLGWDNDEELIKQVRNIYDKSLNSYAKDFSTLGSIIEQIQDLPLNIQPQKRFALPMSSGDNNLLQNRLRIKVKCDDWSIENITEFQSDILTLKKNIDNSTLLVESIMKGSIEQIFSGDLDLILKLAKIFSLVTPTILLTIKGITHLQKERYLIKEKKFLVAKQEERYKRESKLQDIIIVQNQLELLEKEQKKLNNQTVIEIDSIALDNGIDLNKFIESKKGEVIKSGIPILNEKFPFEEVEVYLNVFKKSD